MSSTAASFHAFLDRPESAATDWDVASLAHPGGADAETPGTGGRADPVMTVLHVTREPGEAARLTPALEGPGARLVLEPVSSMLEATLRLGDDPPPDALLLDRLSGPDAASLMGRVRQRDETTAIVVAVEADDHDEALSALDAGADDYVVWDRTSPDALRATLIQAISSRKARPSRGNRAIRVLYAGNIDAARQSLARQAPELQLVAPPAGPGGEPVMPDSPLPDGSAPYDVLIVEHGAPGIDTLALLGDLSRTGLGMPVVVITRPDQDKVAALALRRGAAAHLARTPRTFSLLPATIARVVSEAQVARNYARVSRTAAHLQAILEAQPQGVLLVSRDGTVAGANPAMIAAAGATERQDLIGRSLFSLVAPDDRDAIRALVRGVCDGERRSARLEIPAPDGGRALDVDAVPMTIPAGGPTVMLALVREVESTPPAEPRLSFFEAASGPTPMFIVQDRRFRYANRAMTELMAATEDGLEGVPFDDILAPESRDKLAQVGAPAVRRVRLRRQDGAECWGSLHLSPVEFEGRDATLAVAFDITASVALERMAQELDARCDELARRVAGHEMALRDSAQRAEEACATERARAASLQEALEATEARCRQLAEEAAAARVAVPASVTPATATHDGHVTDGSREKDLARRLARSERVGQLAMSIAADWATVLDTIDERSRRLLSLNGGGNPETDARGIIEAAGRARPLARQLLAFSRKQMQPAQPVDLNALLDRNTSLMRQVAGAAIDLALDVDPVLEPVPADAEDLQAALMYLLLAARELLPLGGRVTCRTTAAPGGVTLGIEACGLGMDKGLQEALAAASEEASAGSLAPVRKFLATHDAQMSVEAEPGWKTTFTLRLTGVV